MSNTEEMEHQAYMLFDNSGLTYEKRKEVALKVIALVQSDKEKALMVFVERIQAANTGIGATGQPYSLSWNVEQELKAMKAELEMVA